MIRKIAAIRLEDSRQKKIYITRWKKPGRHEIVGVGLIDQVSDRLFELKYLNDEDYARDYISDRINLSRVKFLMKKLN